MITLHMKPEVSGVEWSRFCAEAPPFSIALDGYVPGPPRLDTAAPCASFNHHEGVDRLSTRSTCAQVLLALRMGLYERFRDSDGPRADVFANDCDEDVCLAWTILNNPHLADDPANPILNRLVGVEDLLDCTAGMYPMHKDSPILRELAWVFEPYRQFRLSGQLNRREVSAFASIVKDVEGRILRYVVGHGDTMALDTRYEVLFRGNGWLGVREIGAQARVGLVSDGCRAFVSVRQRGDGRWTYSIGRLSPFVAPDLSALCSALNAIEPGWGGGDTIIGSPRPSGSALLPDELFAMVAGLEVGR